jgi:hypothetical protein
MVLLQLHQVEVAAAAMEVLVDSPILLPRLHQIHLLNQEQMA